MAQFAYGAGRTDTDLVADLADDVAKADPARTPSLQGQSFTISIAVRLLDFGDREPPHNDGKRLGGLEIEHHFL